MTAQIGKAVAPGRVQGVSMRSRLLGARETGVFLAFLVMCAFLALTTDSFLTLANLLNVGRQVSLLGIMAVGMTFVLISGEIDLSIGSTYALAGLGAGMAIAAGYGVAPAIALGLSLGVLVGLINGLLSTYGRLPSLIATLGMMSVIRGVALLMTNGERCFSCSLCIAIGILREWNVRRICALHKKSCQRRQPAMVARPN